MSGQEPSRSWRRTEVMGVLNVTPDSFSDGGRYVDVDAAVARSVAMLTEGATIIDVGGESTRPGAEPVTLAAELERVEPVIAAVEPLARAVGARVSVDTRHAEVATAAVEAGATIINDVSASLHDTAAALGVTWIAMHMQGEPSTMQRSPTYDDVVADVTGVLLDAVARARDAGVPDVWIDPGIGFGKTFEHNWDLLASLDRIVACGVPVVVGTSRKAFLGRVAAEADGADAPVPADDRLEGSVTTAVWAAMRGASVVRVHDVAATVAALDLLGPTSDGRHADLASVGGL